VDPSLKGVVSEEFALRHRLVPIDRRADTLIVAMDDPTLSKVVDDLRRRTGLAIEIVTSTASAIDRCLNRLYRSDFHGTPALSNADLSAANRTVSWGTAMSGSTRDEQDQDVRRLLRVALDRHASDVHLEATGERIQVRFRIDGVLRSFGAADLADDVSRHVDLLSRFKALGTLDADERRKPQQGSFRIWVDGVGLVHCRLSVIPGNRGDHAVIRVLDPRDAPDSIES